MTATPETTLISHSYTVTAEDVGCRLDVFLLRHLQSFSRTLVARLIKEGQIVCSRGTKLKPSHRISIGDKYQRLVLPLAQKLKKAFDQPLDLRYQDDFLLVIYKPAGLVVHPGIGNKDRTLVNILAHHYPEANFFNPDSFRPGIVHRLDKETSGFLIVAKTHYAHMELCEMIKKRLVRREYLALVHSFPEPSSGEVRGLIKKSQKKMIIGKCTGKTAITQYQLLARTVDRKYSLVHCKLETGRTHQIRLHMKSIGCPVIGDKIYGAKKDLDLYAEHHALWAHSLHFVHPFTHKEMSFYIEPTDIILPFFEKILSDNTYTTPT